MLWFKCLHKDRNIHILDFSGDPEKKNRNVVLVTNDRILRIKAFNEEVPSRNVPKFMQWAGLSKK